MVDEEFKLSKACVSLLEGLLRKDPETRLGMKVAQIVCRVLER